MPSIMAAINRSGLAMGGQQVAIPYLLRDQFTTNASAPLTSPRICEPGPGTGVITDANNKMSIANNKLTWSGGDSNNHGCSILSGTSWARATGLAALASLTRVSGTGTMSMGWTENNGSTAVIQGPVMKPDSSGLLRFYDGAFTNFTHYGDSVANATEYQTAMILRSTGFWFAIKGGAYTDWTLAWVDNASNAATLWASLQSYSAVMTADDWVVQRFGGAWATDYGIAVARSAAPASDTALYMNPDSLVEFTWTPAANETMEFDVRRYDADNRWVIRCTQATGKIAIWERNTGNETERTAAGGVAQTWTVGTAYRILVFCVGQQIRVYINNAARCSYLTATFNIIATETRVTGHATGANFVVWPRTLVGLP